jgi:guanosine-3',5'-bis(diphosphate) 3'-pyrophosphohydrolase
LQFAAYRHRDHRRKDAGVILYINRLNAVAQCLATNGHAHDLTVLRAAILHDTVEDIENTVDGIAARFGADVAGIVLGVTDDKSLTNRSGCGVGLITARR